MNPKAVKAIDANLLDMMALHVGKNLTRVYTDEAIDDTSAMMAKLEDANKRNTELEVEVATLRERCASMEKCMAEEKDDAEEDAQEKVELALARAEAAAAQAACAKLQDTVAQLTVEVKLLQSCMTEDATETEDDSEEESGCEIEVLRGGDDRIRSLRVRYTK